MGDNLLTSLWLTGAGMGLVFGAIVVFWLLMSAVVRLAADRPARSGGKMAESPEALGEESDEDLRQGAAAAAVAVAVALRSRRGLEWRPAKTGAALSPWQAVWRSRTTGTRGKGR
jgi:Na+-transporting methylmalonyl-CoA/oxaloacetate decarboxylase gamma subunit